ncbi:MAG: Kazal domain-containing protein [Pseudomonadota bacterium]
MKRLSTSVAAVLMLLAAACTNFTAPPAEPSAPVVGLGEICGGIVGAVCEGEGDTTFCKSDVGACGELAGVCSEIPQICTADFKPICGCDGQDYSNSCVADRAGVNVASEGKCG